MEVVNCKVSSAFWYYAAPAIVNYRWDWMNSMLPVDLQSDM
jgi:hypothetical protein